MKYILPDCRGGERRKLVISDKVCRNGCKGEYNRDFYAQLSKAVNGWMQQINLVNLISISMGISRAIMKPVF